MVITCISNTNPKTDKNLSLRDLTFISVGTDYTVVRINKTTYQIKNDGGLIWNYPKQLFNVKSH